MNSPTLAEFALAETYVASIPAGYRNHSKRHVGFWKPWLRQAFMFRCAYCTASEAELCSAGYFQIDHFVPRKRDRTRSRDYYNLVYACYPCNQRKRAQFPSEQQLAQGIELLNPSSGARFPFHITENASGWLTGKTQSGSLSVQILALNTRDDVRERNLRRAAEIDNHRALMRRLAEFLMQTVDLQITRGDPTGQLAQRSSDIQAQMAQCRAELHRRYGHLLKHLDL
ncbi:hypothetical protein PHYC_02031 [Phycisphaerales bacterium]|nr:hypothetical protein PHYC_02031 [Phycisphaerales bacterium]